MHAAARAAANPDTPSCLSPRSRTHAPTEKTRQKDANGTVYLLKGGTKNSTVLRKLALLLDAQRMDAYRDGGVFCGGAWRMRVRGWP